ncbi:tryptophan--tRNA ligase [Candidatus Nomurabacteria bacterium]|nr:tryptophan--tRNA ligase [Candidatus Nomurabacteria bacterium]
MKQVILTGLRANNDLTIGNYFGGILPIVDMAKKHADEYQINMFIPDLHSFTTPIDHSKLQEQILHNAKLFVTAGLPINHESVYLYRQSYIPAHSELTVILNSFTGMGEMSRMTQYKDKSSKLGDSQISVGLFDYPVLMAADILLYGAKYVPVGDDQTQHLEFTRDIAGRMNSRFDELFTVPDSVASQHKFFGKDQGLRIMDLVDPARKMSKSDDSGKGVIFLGDDPELAAKKIMSATTDGKASVNLDYENQPGISNLLEILALLEGVSVQAVADKYADMERYGDFKSIVADEVKNFLTDFQTRLEGVDDTSILSKLAKSESTMNIQANETLLRVQRAVGLRQRV